MTSEEEKYYERYFDLFLSDGWKQFINDITETLDTHRIEDIKDSDHLAYLKGERAVLLKMQSFETAIKNNYDYVLEAENAEET